MSVSLTDLENYINAKTSLAQSSQLIARGKMIAFAGLGIGAGIGIAAYGLSFFREPGRISKVELTNPVVSLDPQTSLKLGPIEPVKFDTPPLLRVDPNSSVRVEQAEPFRVETVSRPDFIPRLDQVRVPEGTSSRVVTDFTIFHHYKVNDKDQVITGWTFDDNQASFPRFQYCYLSRTSPSGELEDVSVKFALNGEIVRASSSLMNERETREMFTHCVWFAGTKDGSRQPSVDSEMVPVGRPSIRR